MTIIRKNADSPRKRKVLSVEQNWHDPDQYIITIKDNNLRTLEEHLCNKRQSQEFVNEWEKDFITIKRKNVKSSAEQLQQISNKHSDLKRLI